MKPLTYLATATIGLLAGCDNAPPPPAARIPVAAIPAGHATVSGVVNFDGPAPQRNTVRNEPCCPGAPPTQLDESAIVTNGKLANVFVFLEGGPKADGSALPPALLDQVFCRYVPHAVGVVVGQPLTLRSSDATMHNVAIAPPGEGAQNFAMYHAGDTAQTHFTVPGFAASKCDVHPWMRATIGVFDNSYFAVTGEDGTYSIANVPDGQYTLVARHELFGELRQPITIKAGQSQSADFRYHPPTP